MLGSGEGHCLFELVVVSDGMDRLHKSTGGPGGRDFDTTTARVE